MEQLFLRKKLNLPAGSAAFFLPELIALLLGAVLFTVIREQAVCCISSLGNSLGIEASLLAMAGCMLIFGAVYFGVMSAAAVVIVPCLCAFGGFAAEAVSYIYVGNTLSFPAFPFFALLLFAYFFSVLFVSSRAMKLSKSIRGCIGSDRKLKTELIRYQAIFILMAILLLVSGYYLFLTI